jgi:heme-degrading monooxygenase HmoA
MPSGKNRRRVSVSPEQEALIVIAVISEVWPHADRYGDYDALAQELRPLLEAIDGFISAERFESCTEPGKFLSLSVWRDEAALADWRNLEEHRVIMAKGRGGILRDYRIRATSVLWDYGLSDRAQAPVDSRALFG